MVKIIGVMIAICGVIMIYDARSITKKFFSFGDQNEGSMGLKFTGFLITIVGSFIVFYNML